MQTSVQSYFSEIEKADKLAALLVKHQTNEKGEALALVHENQGFQEVYDYNGNQKKRHRLERKKEQIFNQYDAKQQLFQKVYYSQGLTLADETKLREQFNLLNNQHDNYVQATGAALFLGFWPAAYKLSAQVRPTSLAIFAAGYYFGFYKSVIQPFGVQRLQQQLNQVAQPLANKYGL